MDSRIKAYYCIYINQDGGGLVQIVSLPDTDPGTTADLPYDNLVPGKYKFGVASMDGESPESIKSVFVEKNIEIPIGTFTFTHTNDYTRYYDGNYDFYGHENVVGDKVTLPNIANVSYYKVFNTGTRNIYVNSQVVTPKSSSTNLTPTNSYNVYVDILDITFTYKLRGYKRDGTLLIESDTVSSISIDEREPRNDWGGLS